MTTKISYREKLKDPRWQRRRLEILSKNDFHCVACGDGESTLNVHHVLYRKNADPWDYSDKELQCLCEDYHKSAEESRADLLAELANTFPPNEATFRIAKILKMFNEIPDGFHMLWAWMYAAYYPDILGNAYARANDDYPLIKDMVRTGEKTQEQYEAYVKSARNRSDNV